MDLQGKRNGVGKDPTTSLPRKDEPNFRVVNMGIFHGTQNSSRTYIV